MDKFKVNEKQKQALDYYLINYNKQSDLELVKNYLISKVNKFNSEENLCLNDLTHMDMAKILINGYELVETN